MNKLQSDMSKAREIIDQLLLTPNDERKRKIHQLVRQHGKTASETYSKSDLLEIYRKNYSQVDLNLLNLLKKKPIRSLSGVTPVTILTKPYPCPGECIFCPVDVRMPKSYIASEPGAARAAQNGFDPYLQVYNRLQAYHDIGHPIGKIELIVLGGTWSVYKESYQRWFITRAFHALNDFAKKNDRRPQNVKIDLTDSLPEGQKYNTYIAAHSLNLPENEISWDDLEKAHENNETSDCRCVGLVLETRPDYITKSEIRRLRRLGATKIQIGIQSLSDSVLLLNKRGHTVDQTREAIRLLRLAGFKIHAHWMPNLYGSTPEKDIHDFDLLFKDEAICPDELKVYPCSLIEKTELVEKFDQGLWRPYTKEELSSVLLHVLTHTPEYCRLTRIIRDIPGQEILTGNKTTNFRQILEQDLDPNKMHDIRSREVKGMVVSLDELSIEPTIYNTTATTEYFIQYITSNRKIAAFIRLSLPLHDNEIEELKGHALIREVHVYGQSLSVGDLTKTKAQHQGLGTKLIDYAKKISAQAGFSSISVISSIGTREYYRKLGFVDGELYQHIQLGKNETH